MKVTRVVGVCASASFGAGTICKKGYEHPGLVEFEAFRRALLSTTHEIALVAPALLDGQAKCVANALRSVISGSALVSSLPDFVGQNDQHSVPLAFDIRLQTLLEAAQEVVHFQVDLRDGEADGTANALLSLIELAAWERAK